MVGKKCIFHPMDRQDHVGAIQSRTSSAVGTASAMSSPDKNSPPEPGSARLFENTVNHQENFYVISSYKSTALPGASDRFQSRLPGQTGCL